MHTEIRHLNKDELRQIAIQWAANEGWNPGIYDAESFYAADPDGFWVSMVNKEAVACISAVKYDTLFAFIGFYIVKPEFRGHNIGIELWQHVLKELNTHNIGLDGVLAQQNKYTKSGFNFAYRNCRFAGMSKNFNHLAPNIVPLNTVDFNSILNYDSQLFPASRETFLKSWVTQPESGSWVALDNNKIAGYACIRKCQNGYKIGPLFADNSTLAEQLFIACQQYLPSETAIYLDIPEVNIEAIKMAEKYNMQKVFETARMYTKKLPDIDLNKIFGVTSFELG